MKIEIKKGSIEEVMAERAVKIMGYSNTTEFVRSAIRLAYKEGLDVVHEKAGEWNAENVSSEERQQMTKLQGFK